MVAKSSLDLKKEHKDISDDKVLREVSSWNDDQDFPNKTTRGKSPQGGQNQSTRSDATDIPERVRTIIWVWKDFIKPHPVLTVLVVVVVILGAYFWYGPDIQEHLDYWSKK